MNFVEEYLNLIKRKIGLNQEDIANELNYSRGYISMAKKSPTTSFSDILLKTFGFVRPGDLTYEKTLNDLKKTVDIVKEKTGLNEYEISKQIYGKENNISESLNGDWVSPRMTIAIKKRFSYIFDKINPQFLDIADYNSSEYLKILKQLPEFKDADFIYKLLSKEMEPLLSSNTILAGKKIDKPVLPNRIYLVKLNNGQIAIGKKVVIEDNGSVQIFPNNVQFESTTTTMQEIQHFYEIIAKITIANI